MWKNLLLTLILTASALFISGCSSPHTVVLKDGTEIRARDEPRFDERTGFYQLEDEEGRIQMINKDEVRMVREGE